MIIEAILKINPNAKVVVRGSDINTCEIEWLNGTTPIPVADIEAKMAEMANEPEQSAYVEQRRNDYPPIGDQLDMLWHSIDKDDELQHKFYDFYQTVKKTKVKFPKQ
jgi:hypothetical protein